MADNTSEAANGSDLSSRITVPEKSNTTDTPTSNFSWADDAATPTEPTQNTSSLPAAQTDGAADTAKDMAEQKDGATTWLNGSQGLDEPEFDVNVKLADLQENPDNPLFSVKNFSELNL